MLCKCSTRPASSLASLALEARHRRRSSRISSRSTLSKASSCGKRPFSRRHRGNRKGGSEIVRQSKAAQQRSLSCSVSFEELVPTRMGECDSSFKDIRYSRRIQLVFSYRQINFFSPPFLFLHKLADLVALGDSWRPAPSRGPDPCDQTTHTCSALHL